MLILTWRPEGAESSSSQAHQFGRLCGHQFAEGGLVLAELISDGPDHLAALGGGDFAPASEGLGGFGDGALVLRGPRGKQ